MAIVLIPITVGINIVGGAIATSLKLPVWIDTIGTMVAAVLAGPWVAAVVGFLTNAFLALTTNPVYLPYSLVNVAIGIAVGIMAQRGWFGSPTKVLLGSIIVVFIQVLVASPISVFMFGGASGATGTSLITAYFMATTQKIWASVLKTQFIFAALDKTLSMFVAYFVIKSIPSRFVSKVVKHQA